MMCRQLKLAAVLSLLMVVLSGCWDNKNIQDINYMSAIGVDFVDNEYVVYVQMLDFSTVAKQEGSSKPAEPIKPWIGKAKGENLVAAINELYKSSQQRMFFGQVSALVCSEKILKDGLDQVLDAFNRYREFRYMVWVFGTNASIEHIFTSLPFFNQSPINSILHQPLEPFKQESIIAPVYLREFVMNYREPGNTSFLPFLSTTSLFWKRGDQKHTLLMINGAYALHTGKYMGRFSESQMIGKRWVESNTKRSPLAVPVDGKSKISLSLEEPKVKITSIIVNSQPKFDLDVTVSGYIAHQDTDEIPISVLGEKAAEQIKSEILLTYMEGLKKRTDLLQLEYQLYRQNTAVWKKLKDDFRLTEDSLRTVHVKVQLTNSGRYEPSPA